ncbi:General transcription factor II-I repeat domain-containing protein 2-like [Oopsacas minuta]|uniref:General transcription factor II-I repeat domain-containing protein 2-like n=1 Tax=Oopsacas minuta TaxID=111878 RepID=A0AAV7JHU6_9METZ|nr:General transcription factor II-I repeat domain-containing protein 2-like [Oopsacas minuta]
MKPFTDGEFIKECLNEFADQCCPDKKQLIQQVSLSATTVMRRVESISKNIHTQLLEKTNCFSFCSLALDGSKDICYVGQLAIWIRGVDENFNITEELLSLSSMQGRTRGIDIFEEFLKTVSENNIPALRLSDISTDGAHQCLVQVQGLKVKFYDGRQTIM